MLKTSDEIYNRINNHIYDTEGDIWWSTDSVFHLIREIFNPARVPYAKRIVSEYFNGKIENLSALEVGCGGGILCEEVARMGFITSGIDPSQQSITAAKRHSELMGLKIEYFTGTGEDLAFPENSFDVVFCCDVLEHVRDLPQVMSEISRVLRSGGIFIYDTFNRTILSKLIAIKLLQDWKRWAIIPSHLHEWRMFIKPSEMKLLLQQNKLIWKEHKGIKPNVHFMKIPGYLNDRMKGDLTWQGLGKKFHMVEGTGTSVMYMGYAIRQ